MTCWTEQDIDLASRKLPLPRLTDEEKELLLIETIRNQAGSIARTMLASNKPVNLKPIWTRAEKVELQCRRYNQFIADNNMVWDGLRQCYIAIKQEQTEKHWNGKRWVS